MTGLARQWSPRPNWPTPFGAADQVGLPAEWHLDIWSTHCSVANCVAAKAALANESLHHCIVFSCSASDSASLEGRGQGTQKHIWTDFCFFFPSGLVICDFDTCSSQYSIWYLEECYFQPVKTLGFALGFLSKDTLDYLMKGCLRYLSTLSALKV